MRFDQDLILAHKLSPLPIYAFASAATLAHAVVWPGERRIQRLLAEAPPAGTGDGPSELGRDGGRVQWAAVCIDVVFVAVLVSSIFPSDANASPWQ